MNLKRVIILIGLPIFCSFQPNNNQPEMISLDAKYTCNCLKTVVKKVRRLENKVERQEKKTYKYGKKNKPLFEGYSIIF